MITTEDTHYVNIFWNMVNRLSFTMLNEVKVVVIIFALIARIVTSQVQANVLSQKEEDEVEHHRKRRKLKRHDV